MKMFNKNGVVIAIIASFVFGLVGPIPVIAAGPSSVELSSAGNFAVLAKSGISTTGTTSIVGDIGVSPAEATYITGFALNLPAGSAFSTSPLVSGKVYAPSYAVPTPTKMTTAVSDMEIAYTNAMSRTNPTATELGAGNIGGMTLAPGLYKWGTGVTIPTDVTLSGGGNDVWIFQIAQNLTVSEGVKVNLIGGAHARNIFWAVAGQTTIGTTAVFNGNILDQTAIVLNTGAVLNGRALAQTAVTLNANSVIIPSGSQNEPSPTSVVAQSSGSTTVTYSSGNTETTMNTGCSGENKFNTSNGQLCVNNINNVNQNPPVYSKFYNFGTSTLKNGSRGEGVKELQRFLNVKLNLGLWVDGKLGPKTIAVVKQWQRDHGLVEDGLIGAKTKAKMNIEAAKD